MVAQKDYFLRFPKAKSNSGNDVINDAAQLVVDAGDRLPLRPRWPRRRLSFTATSLVVGAADDHLPPLTRWPSPTMTYCCR